MPHKNSRLTASLVAEMRSEIGAGRATVTDYAHQLGARWRTVESAVYGWTWASIQDPPPLEPPPPPAACEPPAFARLTATAVASMRTRFTAGDATTGELAREYRVSESTARSAILGYTWRRVSVPPARRAKVGGWTVVSDADLREIERRRSGDQPETYRSIGAALRLDATVVFRAYRGLLARGAADGGAISERTG